MTEMHIAPFDGHSGVLVTRCGEAAGYVVDRTAAWEVERDEVPAFGRDFDGECAVSVRVANVPECTVPVDFEAGPDLGVGERLAVRLGDAPVIW